MKTLHIDIIDAKVEKLINNLAEMDLIKIRPEKNRFSELLIKTRQHEKEALSLEDITREVKAARKIRYGM